MDSDALVQTHMGEPAVNVKDRTPYGAIAPYAKLIETLPEHETQSSFDQAREWFWTEAQTIAQTMGYGDIWADGRSGGWLHVSNPPNTEDLQESEEIQKSWKEFNRLITTKKLEARRRFLELLHEKTEKAVRN